MAAHTTDGSAKGRRFQIGRENGSKTGKAVLLEWIPEIPENQAGRKFETRTSDSGKVRHYEVFTAIDGKLTKIYTEERQILNETRRMLYVVLDDGIDVQEIEIGDVDGRYSLNLLPRLLNANADFEKTIRLSPYAYEKDGKNIIGIGVYCGPDDLPRPENGVLKLAEPTQTPHKGSILWDFMPVFDSLWSLIETNVIPKLNSLPAGVSSSPQAVAADFPTVDVSTPEPEPANSDDLPF